jgi:tetratricopeptide (TPR) repeat protein
MATLDQSVQVDSQAIDQQHPWLGLHAFTEQLQQYFYGRESEAEELFRRVNRKPLTVLFGQSGLGKTSLLRAGLFPRMRKAGYLPIAIRLDHAPQAPELATQIITALRAAVSAAGAHLSEPSSSAQDATTLWEFFHRLDFSLKSSNGQPLVPVLVFDQFEEIFTLGRESEELRQRSARLLTQIADLVENRPPKPLAARFDDEPELVEHFEFSRADYRVLLCLREDYLAMLEDMRQRMPSLSENRMRLCRMNGEQALDAVSRPGGHLMSPAVSRQIVKFVARTATALRHVGNGESSGLDEDLSLMEVEPALLSLFCAELNTRRIAQGFAEITPDLLAGSRDTILNDYYERCMLQVHPEVRRFIEDELLTESGYRENVALETAERRLSQRGAPENSLEQLVRQRLLHIEERLHVRRVELTHDVLTNVVRKSRDARQQNEEAERARAGEEQVRQQLRKSRRRMAAVIAVMGAVMAVISAFGLFSYYQWQEAKRLKNLAESAQHDAEEQRALAKGNEQRANDRAHAAETLENLARDYLISAGQDLHQIAADHPGLAKTYFKFLKDSLNKLDAVLQVNPNAKWARQQRAYTLAFCVENARKLEGRQAAIDYARKAIQAARETPDDADAPRTVGVTAGIAAEELINLQEYDLATEALRVALNALERAHADATLDLSTLMGTVLSIEGKLYAAKKEYPLAIASFDKAIALHERWLKEQPDDVRRRDDLVDFNIQAASTHLKLNDVDRAIEKLEKAKDIRVKLWRENDTIRSRNQLAYVFEELAWAYRVAKNVPKARSAYQNMENARRSMFIIKPGVLPDDFVYDPDASSRNLISSLEAFGGFEYALGDPAIGEKKYAEALDTAEKLRQRVPDLTNLDVLSGVHLTWGASLEDRKELPEAEKHYRAALDLRETTLKERPDDPLAKGELAFVLGKLASMLTDQARWDEALPLSERRVQLRREVHDKLNEPDSAKKLGDALGLAAFHYLFATQPEKALAAGTEAAQLEPDALWIRMNRAHALLLTDHVDEAQKVYLENASAKVNGHSFADEARNDFRMFRKAGLNDPRLDQIEAQLPPPEAPKAAAAETMPPEKTAEDIPRVEQRSGPPQSEK